MKTKVIWITGLPGAGKSTVANKLSLSIIKKYDEKPLIIDGDFIRKALGDYDYSKEGRLKLAYSYMKMAHLFSQQGHIVICATVSMFEEVRIWGRDNISGYLEVFLECPIEVLKKRNKKGLYTNQKNQLINNVFSYNFDYDIPRKSDIYISNTQNYTIENIVREIMKKVNKDGQ